MMMPREPPCGDWMEGGEPCAAAIYDVKLPDLIDDGVEVTVEGIATAVRFDNEGQVSHIVLQMMPDSPEYDGAQYSGVWIFAGNAAVDANAARRGQHLRITASTNTFFGQRQLQNVTGIEAIAADLPIPAARRVSAADVGTDGPLAAAYEGVFVEVRDAAVTAVDPEPGPGDMAPTNEFVINESLRVNDYLYLLFPLPRVGAEFPRIAGVLRFGNAHNKLEPRIQGDIELGPPQLIGFGPAETFLVLGEESLPRDADDNFLTIELNQLAPEEGVRVDLEFDPAFLALPDDADHIIVPWGNFSADAPFIPLQIGEDLEVTARYDGREITARIDVLEGAPLPETIEVDLPPQLAFGATFNLVIRIDQAAPEQGLSFAVNTVPEGALLGDPFPLIQAGAREVQALYTVGMMPGPVMIEVTSPALPGVVGMAETNVVEALPGANLVINEVDYDQPGQDSAEFVELFNRGDAPINLANLQLQMVNGSNNMVYGNYPLADAGAEVAPGGYIVVGNAAVIGALPDGVLSIELPANGLQNGGPDGVRLVNLEGERLDGFSYEGVMPDVTEGAGSDAQDFGEGSVGRCPNGADTNDNLADFAFEPMPSPGVANACAPPVPE